jgi:hypothetical protein
MEHRLRRYSDDNITDDELNEVEEKIDFDHFEDPDSYEFNGNFIFTKDCGVRAEAVDNMCCGIVEEDIEISNDVIIYFAFDYGH